MKGILTSLAAAVIMTALFASAAHAVGRLPPNAPAPLLGAGIPALIAVGGGALMQRLRRRWHK
jgi:hypothetical protein